MMYKEFVKQRISIPIEEAEPFCPFGISYCNDAYSEKCYSCQESWNEYIVNTKSASQTERCCLNCRNAHEESWGLVCFGQKDAPKVYSDDVCEDWKPIEDAEGWRDITIVGFPNEDDEVIIYCKSGVMHFAKYHNNEQDGEYWAIRGPYDIRHYIKTNWVTHWKPKPKKPVMG